MILKRIKNDSLTNELLYMAIIFVSSVHAIFFFSLVLTYFLAVFALKNFEHMTYTILVSPAWQLAGPHILIPEVSYTSVTPAVQAVVSMCLQPSLPELLLIIPPLTFLV